MELINEEALWELYLEDARYSLDIPYAKKRFFKVPKDIILKSFSINVIEGSDELRFLPNILFNKYFDYFISFILIGHHDEFETDDIASCFVTLLHEKLESNSFTNQSLLERTIGALDFLEQNIDFYNNHPEIYGDLNDKLKV